MFGLQRLGIQLVQLTKNWLPYSDEKIHVDLLPELITQLSAPLGLKDRPVTSALLMEVIKDLHIPIRRNNCVGYKDTFLAWYCRLCLVLTMSHVV